MKKMKIVLNKSPHTSATLDWLGNFLKLLSIFLILSTFVFRIAVVDGRSMETTLIDTDRLLVTDLFYVPQNGDIIVISRGAEIDKPLVKRVIAVAGQELRIDYEKNSVYVDGVMLDEPYIQGKTIRGTVPESELNGIVPQGKVFVMGDNREHSTDSRFYSIGLIDMENIIGKVQLKLLPHSYDAGDLTIDFSRFGSVYSKLE